MADDSPILDVRGLNVSFGQKDIYTQVTDEVSFSLTRGKCLGIVGESGSGKSVTSLSILNLLSANPNSRTKGEVYFDSQEGRVELLESKGASIQKIRGKQISMIFQEPMSTFNPVRKCGPQVKEVLDVHNYGASESRKERVLDYLRKVTLPDVGRIYNSYPHELSGGQLQRVSIAMALVASPDIVICDEPTTALDVTVQKEVIQLLKTLCQDEGVSMIFVSHDLDVVASLCDEVIVMYHGDIAERGLLPDTFLRPQHLYTKALLKCKPTLEKQAFYLPTVSSIMSGQEELSPRPNNVCSINKEIVIEVNGIHVKFPKKRKNLWSQKEFLHAVDDVSFKILKGSTLGIVGESGSGKTTVANCIAGLLNPQEGNIKYKGRKINKRVYNANNGLRREIQLVFQDPYSSLNPSMTVGAAVAEPIKYHKLREDVDARVIELFDQVGLDQEFKNRYPHQLSGGQRQRVCIARAISVEPQLLICDESVSALDVSVQAQILNLLSRLQHDLQLTMLFISHDLSVVSYICDDVIVMKNGAIVEQGNCAEIISNPQHPYTQRLINSIPERVDVQS